MANVFWHLKIKNKFPELMINIYFIAKYKYNVVYSLYLLNSTHYKFRKKVFEYKCGKIWIFN
jgi:hypothetical protein